MFYHFNCIVVRILIVLILLVGLAACQDRIGEVTDKVGKAGVTVVFSSELQQANDKATESGNGALSVSLNVDGADYEMTRTSEGAWLEWAALTLETGQHDFTVTVYFPTSADGQKVKVDQANKTTGNKDVVFRADSFGQQQPAIDDDLDGMSNLEEVIVGGDPNNPNPTFISADMIDVPNKQIKVVTVQAISSNPTASVTYQISGGIDQSLFALDTTSGYLTFVNPPVFNTDGGKNSYLVEITASGGNRATVQQITITIYQRSPIITGQINLSTAEDTAISLVLADLTVTNNDTVYPEGFSMTVGAGDNYTVSDRTITPAANYNGSLTVPVSVSDGIDNSETFDVTITVTPVNDAPIITGQKVLNSNINASFTISLTDLTVTDVDNTYPAGFSLVVQPGTDYTVSGTEITPTANYSGSLNVPILVNDGNTNSDTANSNTYSVTVNVVPVLLKGITITPSVTQTITSGNSIQYTATGAYSNGTTANISKTVSWSSNPSTSVIFGAPTGTVTTSLGFTGSVTITANLNGVTDSATLNVNTAQVSGLTAKNKGIKTLNFSWLPVQGATYYKLLYQVTSGAGYTQVGSNTTGTNIDVTIALHLTDWVYTSYIVEACDAGASCILSLPVSITDLMIQAIGYVKASNTRGADSFGFSVSLSGDGNTLVVGAYGEASAAKGIDGEQIVDCDLITRTNCAPLSGAVHVYRRDTAGDWGMPVYIKASNTGDGDWFGSSVSLSGDGNTLAVGALYEDSAARGININSSDQIDDCGTITPTNCAEGSGAVYVYRRDAGGIWSATPVYIKASNTGTGDSFGSPVSLSGDGNTLAVGASGEDSAAQGVNGNQINDCGAITPTNCASHSGAVYVYRRDAGGFWDATPVYLKASNTGAGDSFGQSIKLSGNGKTLAVGAGDEDSAAQGVHINSNQIDDCDPITLTNCAVSSGAVYVYRRDASGLWGDVPVYVKSPNAEAYDFFGRSVSLSSDGNTLAVGALGEDSAARGININSDQIDDCGAITPTNCASNSGAVYVYRRDASGLWGDTPIYIKASNTGAGDEFGHSVNLNGEGNTLAVGAGSEDSAAQGINGSQIDDCLLADGTNNPSPMNCASHSGAVYVYRGDARGFWDATPAYIKASNTGTNDTFGQSGELSLSHNGDTLAVGAYYEDSAAQGININSNQVDDCGAIAPTNCATRSGAVYLY